MSLMALQPVHVDLNKSQTCLFKNLEKDVVLCYKIKDTLIAELWTRETFGPKPTCQMVVIDI